jgi:hypothetical protein
VSTSKLTLKQKALRGFKEYLVIAAYLGIVFSLFAIYKSVILARYSIEFAPQGLALINALALGKVIVVAQELHLADQDRDAPLIYPTMLKSFVFAVLLACFKIAEEIIIGTLFHGQTFQHCIAVVGESWRAILCFTTLMFVVLIPFFAFTELRRILGEDRLVGAFFRPRHTLNLPLARG